jgi:HCOMODA/2-hydroxy-3-carboxy-muconic semialdehyde decarboxylase
MTRSSLAVAPPSRDLVEELVVGNRIIFDQKIVDAFGHISVRHDREPDKYYLLARNLAPGLVTAADILTFDLDSNPIGDASGDYYSERFIHGEIYKARPDVMAVCHHHAAAVLPFCIAGVRIVPVFHLGAAVGEDIPFWDQQDEFGDTNLLVRKPEEGASLARALGKHPAVLMTHHGATVVGADVRELVSRSIFICQNAQFQLQAHLLGKVVPLSRGETRLAGSLNALPNVTGRTWEYWTMRLDAAGRLPPQPRSGGTSQARKARGAKARAGAGSKAKKRR